MASPQKENGYTAIANEIMEALARIRLPGAEYSITLAVLRLTYGWQKCEAEISYSRLAQITGMARRACIRAFKDLQARRILQVVTRQTLPSDKADTTPANIVKFNKNYDQWVVTALSPSDNVVTRGSDKRIKKPSDQDVTHKRKNIKQNIKQTPFTDDFLLFWSAYPRKAGKKDALKAWGQVNGSRPPVNELLRILEEHKKQTQWTKDAGAFVPLAATWLRGERWNDELKIEVEDEWARLKREALEKDRLEAERRKIQ